MIIAVSVKTIAENNKKRMEATKSDVSQQKQQIQKQATVTKHCRKSRQL